ncbi:hypothetical protein BX666DRAFT_1998923 [Dichotomocladium elegans]|nr:hypothetical protein BX666DRAFT_1998923 [Dichotomocladium elegans]
MGSRSKKNDPARNAIAKGKPVFQGRVISKKKQKQHDRAAKMEKRWLAAKGLIEAEEEMKGTLNASPLSGESKIGSSLDNSCYYIC